jgi:hypothetical protein
MAEYTCTNRTAGSFIVISIGLTKASIAMPETVMWRWSISLWDLNFWLPVSFRRRSARRKRILGLLVSGKEIKRAMSTGADAQIDSYRDQRQFFAVTENPLTRGPREAVVNSADKSLTANKRTYVHRTLHQPRQSVQRADLRNYIYHPR